MVQSPFSGVPFFSRSQIIEAGDLGVSAGLSLKEYMFSSEQVLLDIRAINVGLTHEWGAQRLVYCIDSPSWQTSYASMLAQQGELNHEVGSCGQIWCR